MVNAIIDRIKLPFRKDKELYLALYQILGFLPHDISLYKLALMHKSVAHRNAKGRPVNNERLEFLGDAVLDATVGHIVYDHFPGKKEGFLTNTRSKLVQRETLGKLAKEMGITRLVLSSGRSATHNSYMGGNAFEALVGALYLDHGYDACMKFVQKQILSKLVNIDKVAYKEVNFKSKLIEWTQKNKVCMEYRSTFEGKDENGSPVFECVCVIEGVECCKGKGFSKKEAHQHASEETLKQLRKQPKFCDSIFAAKTARTKMEEEPVMAAPDIEKEVAEKQQFIIVNTQAATVSDTSAPAGHGEQLSETTTDNLSPAHFEIDFSDIQTEAKEPTREDIIAAAEAEAFKN
ncbi:MAG: ribonuclease III [Bacteroidales bacterium]|nr:ribonuclease III [Bacteroidales bacterium]MCM1146253.1 ribonuclease III [Bacteroidales bacterium]MCM1205309.1 ribonuclease III [Bacillota bacterium]MCM1509604.1 ribonuclease III [Clostridium sp.]